MIRVLGAPQRLIASSQTARIHSKHLGCDFLSEASIPLAIKCGIKTYDPADHRPFRGWKAGVYDKNKSICDLSLTDRHWTRLTDPFHQNEIRPDEYEHVTGEAVYGGLLFHHFGHFLLESTARLWWPLREGFKGPIVFQNTEPSLQLPDFAARFFKLIGLSDQIILATNALKFDRVMVPERSFVMKKQIHDSFRLPFLKAGEAVEALELSLPQGDEDSVGLYLSRTHYPTRRTLGERRLQRTFVEAGFTIAHLEELPLERQILLMRRHKTIAGICGSAFHNILFDQDSKSTICICRDYEINPNFFMVDEVMNNVSTYIYSMSDTDAAETLSLRETFALRGDDVRLDLPKIHKYLYESGIY